MKKLIVVVMVMVLSVAVWAGATYVVGGQVESRYATLLEQYGHWGPFTLSSQSFHRGFLCSKAETVLELAVAQGDQDTAVEPVRLVLEHTLRNGPLPFGNGPDGRFSLVPALAVVDTRLVSFTPEGDDLGKLLANAPELKDSFAISRVGLGGSVTSQLHIPPFENILDGNQVTWGGFTFEFKFVPGKKTLVGTLDMPQMSVRGDEGEISWNGFNGQFDLVEAFPMVYVGTSGVVFGTLDMDLPGKEGGEREVVQMKGFEVTSDSRCDGKLVHFSQAMKFDGLTVEGKTYGPGVCDIEARNLDGDVLGDFQSQVQEVYRGANSIDPEELLVQLLPLYSQLADRLLEGSPEMGIRRLHFVTPMGDVDGSVLVKFAGQPGLAMENPAALLQAIEANADVSIHERLVNTVVAGSLTDQLKAARDQGQTPAYSDEEIAAMAAEQATSQVDVLVAQNFIVREGERIKASATFNGGQLVLNGVTLPLFQNQ